MLVDAEGGPVTIAALLPGAFGPGHLEARHLDVEDLDPGA
jgi:hypothetical protein